MSVPISTDRGRHLYTTLSRSCGWIIDKISKYAFVVQHYEIFIAGIAHIQVADGLCAQAVDTECVFKSVNHQISHRYGQTILIQDEIFRSLSHYAVNHGLGSHCGQRCGSGIEIDHSALGPALIGPVQELLCHLIPAQCVAIFSVIKHQALALQQGTIAEQEIYHHCLIGKHISIGYLHHVLIVGGGHCDRGTTCTDHSARTRGATGQYFKHRCGRAIAKYSVATIYHLYDHTAVDHTIKGLVLVQQEIVTGIWQQQAAVQAVGAAFFCRYFQVLLVRECAQSVAQSHIQQGKIFRESGGAVSTQLLVVVHDPVNVAGLADAIAVDLDAIGIQPITIIIQELCQIRIIHISVAIRKQAEKLCWTGQGQQAHDREWIGTAGTPGILYRTLISKHPAFLELASIIQAYHSVKRTQQLTF